jgi:hypothetical protein
MWFRLFWPNTTLSAILFVFALIPRVHCLAESDSFTSRFIDRAEQCYSDGVSQVFVQQCAKTYTIGTANAIRLFSSNPTKVRQL